MLFGSLLMIPSYLLLAFTTLPPKFAMCLLGAAFVLVPAAMWPSIPLVVEPQRVGTAFGLTNMIQNIGLMTFPWLNGHLRVLTQNYTASMVMFASLGVVGFVFSIALKAADGKAGSILEKPGRKEENG
jgi:nitrate/nitrite transporter NarK